MARCELNRKSAGVNEKLLAFKAEKLVVYWRKRAERTKTQFAGLREFKMASNKDGVKVL